MKRDYLYVGNTAVAALAASSAIAMESPTFNVTIESSGTSRSLSYQLAANSSCSKMDFADGAVADPRARVGAESTSDSAAVLFFGDGANGYLSFELTDTQVGLEGNGGNAGQQNFLESMNPGFRTSDWHDYRLIIAPDEENNGTILASVTSMAIIPIPSSPN